MNKKKSVIVMLITITLFSSCTTKYIASSTSPIETDLEYTNLGHTRGTDSSWSLFCLWMFGKPETDEAIEEALKKKGGDVLINVNCYNRTIPFILFSVTTVIVEGEAIKYNIKE